MAFRFYPPRGELRFWSALWLLFGLGGSIFYSVTGTPKGLALSIPVGVLTLGIWLRIKFCGQLLGGLLVIGCLIAIPLIFRNGFDCYRVLRICLSAYFAFLVFRWVQDFDDND